MSINFSHIRGVVWDLDGTLYRYNDFFIESCNIAAAQTVIEMGMDIDFDSAVKMARESEKNFGNSFKFFGDRGINYESYHHVFHEKIDHIIVAKNIDLKSSLSKLTLPMSVLTNASHDWAVRTLQHLDMLDLFEDSRIIALEDVGFKAKAHHKDGFEIALSRINIKAQDALMVEDAARNLVIAKEMGMTTALVHHVGNKDVKEKYIDYIFEDTIEVINNLL